jgi:hypothetical protein
LNKPLQGTVSGCEYTQSGSPGAALDIRTVVLLQMVKIVRRLLLMVMLRIRIVELNDIESITVLKMPSRNMVPSVPMELF